MHHARHTSQSLKIEVTKPILRTSDRLYRGQSVQPVWAEKLELVITRTELITTRHVSE